MEIAKYTITVELNEGIGDDQSGEYPSGDKVYLSNPTKEGYTFMGWYTTPDFKENTKVDNCVVVEENLNLFDTNKKDENFLDVIEEYDNYEEDTNDIPDYDVIN